MLVLASASPRRQEILRGAGIAFVAQPANIDERQQAGEAAQVFAERMATEKAKAIAAIRPNDLILAADTVVVLGDEVLGKPRDDADARRMLHRLSGRTHQVVTGVCLIAGTVCDTRSATTQVHMRAWPEREIEDYVASREPMDKAGAYAIQGGAAPWISRIEGDYDNVVGLPLELLRKMLAAHGWDFSEKRFSLAPNENSGSP